MDEIKEAYTTDNVEVPLQPTKVWKNKYAQKYYETHKAICAERSKKCYEDKKEQNLERMKKYNKKRTQERRDIVKMLSEVQERLESLGINLKKS